MIKLTEMMSVVDTGNCFYVPIFCRIPLPWFRLTKSLSFDKIPVLAPAQIGVRMRRVRVDIYCLPRTINSVLYLINESLRCIIVM